MGTSTSSMGPGAGVSLDPAWLDDIEIPNHQDQTQNNETLPIIISPKGRFANARRGLGEYIRSGDKNSLRRALGHYSRTGMGGAQNLAKRMRTSTKVAANIFNTFQSLRDDENFALGHILTDLHNQGANANQIIDTIVNNVCPLGGSLDEISCRDSGTFALSEFMSRNPNADICNLTDDQIWSLTGMFLGNETFSRIQLDIGQAFEKQEVPVVDRVSRLNEMKEYIQSEISAQLNELRSSGNQTVNLQRLFQATIKNTFEVYEVEV